MKTVSMMVAASGGLVAIGMAGWLQATQVPPVVARFAEADASVRQLGAFLRHA
jgi:hypothetical protein